MANFASFVNKCWLGSENELNLGSRIWGCVLRTLSTKYISFQSGGRFKYAHCHVRQYKIAKLLNSKYNLQWNDYNLISRSLEMSSLIFIFRLDFWIVIHLWNRLYSSFYILGRAKPVPPPRSHSLEQHNYADHKKQPTTATGKGTKDKNNPFAPSQKY